ncbi:hypothetical protein EDD11_002608 [Mortierella claussenii]|nr:hypothetical protein EDD11_002608 [Mortierella claussenii]
MAWNNFAPQTKDVEMQEQSAAVDAEASGHESTSQDKDFSAREERYQEVFETGIEFQKFARPLEKLQLLRTGSNTDFDMVAILPEFEALCTTRAQQFEYRKDSDAEYLAFGAADEHTLWQAESHTWVLLTTLFGAFESRQPYVGKGPEPLEWSDLDLIEHLANTDNNYRHHAAVKVWLETIAPRFTPIAMSKTYNSQANTPARPTFSFSSSQQTSIKKEYQDPDASTRDGTKMSERNQRAEQDLLKTIWEYIRRGKIEEAKKACVHAKEHWRAESIGGGEFYSVPIAFTDPVYDREDDRHGNKTRSLWKGTCYALANDPAADKYERAIYGALSGDVPSVLPVCASWEDHAWAQYNALVESMVETRLSQFNRGGASKALPLPVAKVTSAKDIFASLTNSSSQELRNASQDIFRTIQTSIILGQTDQLLVKMAKDAKISAGAGTPMRPHMLRFMAHFVLLLRSKKSHVPKETGDYFMKSYVDYLISKKMYDLAPLYASFLPDRLQVEGCSSYLKTINGSRRDRQEQVAIIRRNGLDLYKILTATVDGLLEQSKPDLDQTGDYKVNLQKSIMTSTTTQENAAAKALDWFTFDLHHYDECLRRSNYLARKYLMQGRLNAAFALFNSLPTNVSQQNLLQATPKSLSITHEHLCYRDLFSARLLFEEWRDFLAFKPSKTAQRSNTIAWETNLKEKAQKAIVEIETLLSSRWLFDCIVPGVDATRNQELKRLRQIYISELVMNLHRVYFESRVVIPEYLRKSVDMSNLVASETADVPLYKELQESDRLNEFLDQVRMSSIELVREGKSPFAY